MSLTGLALEAFPAFVAQARPPTPAHDADEAAASKTRVPLAKAAGSRFVASLTLDAIVTMRLGADAHSVVVPATRADVLRALAPSTLFLLRTGHQETFAALSRLVARCRPYAVCAGNDPLEVASVLDALLAELAA